MASFRYESFPRKYLSIFKLTLTCVKIPTAIATVLPALNLKTPISIVLKV